MAEDKKRSGFKKPSDELTVLRNALIGNGKAASKVMRAFQTLIRKDSEQSGENPGGQRPGRKKKAPPRR